MVTVIWASQLNNSSTLHQSCFGHGIDFSPSLCVPSESGTAGGRIWEEMRNDVIMCKFEMLNSKQQGDRAEAAESLQHGDPAPPADHPLAE